EQEIQSEDFNVEKLEASSDTYGDYAFLFEISKQDQIVMKKELNLNPKNTKKYKKIQKNTKKCKEIRSE
ncbi:hypothetical protein FW983_08615, partial [Campylobacter jejuni]|nr:hypothetical protein [Campylobacter jejuni]